jgi:hypothetical protein
MTTEDYKFGDPETPEQKAHLDSIVQSGVDGLVLGCVDEVGRITYREALTRYFINNPIEEVKVEFAEPTNTESVV